MHNTVPPGYKQTEVGVIPEEWGISSVGVEFEIQLGKMLDAEKNKGVLKPYLGNKAVQWNYIDVGDLSLIAMSATDLGRYRLKKGDLLVCEGGEVGRAAIWEEQLGECYYQKALHRLRPARSFDTRLMLAYLQHWAEQDLLGNYVTQTSIAHFPKEKFEQIPLPLPPLPEQRAIATALSDVDALIASLDKLIAKKRDMKQAAMQELLTGKRRLPGFDIVGAYGNTPNSRGACTTVKPGECHSPLPDVPHGWEVKKLGEIADIRSGGTPSTSVPQFWEGDIPWCTPTDITALAGRKYLIDTSRKITSSGLQSSSAEMLPTHSIVMTSRATIGECAINTVPVSTNQGFKNFIPFDATDIEFLYYLLTTQKSGFIGLCSGSTFLEIGKAQLLSYQVCLPSKKTEQTAIAAILSDMDTEIAALEQKRDKTRLLKQGMMQELLTGRIRLV